MIQKVSQNDIGTNLKFTIIDQDKNIVNLTGTTVTLYIQRSDTTLTKTCTLSDPTNGIATYSITANDLSIGDDTYYLSVKVGYTSGSQFSAIDKIPLQVVKTLV